MSTTTLLIDNYDSFTYNLFDLLCAVDGDEPDVLVNDAPLSEAELLRYRRIVISPGPGRPDRATDVGIGRRAIASGLPILGVCLGHQVIVTELGGTVDRMPEPWHGLVDTIAHEGRGLFDGMPERLRVVRYHSLAATAVPESLRVTARGTDGTVMAVEHRSRPLWGVQFHPESVCSAGGRRILENFRRLTADPGTPHARRADTASTILTVTDRQAPGAEPDRASAAGSGGRRLRHRLIDRNPDPTAVWELFATSPSAFWLDREYAAPGSRHSIMGDAGGPFGYTLRYQVGRGARIERPGEQRTDHRPLLEVLRTALGTLPDLAAGVEVPFDFRLGFVGLLGYGLGVQIGPPGYPGRTAPGRPQPATGGDTPPDAVLVHAGRAVVIDHDRGQCHLLALSDADTEDAVERWLSDTARSLSRATTAPTRIAGATPTPPSGAPAAAAPATMNPPDPMELAALLRDEPTIYLRRIDACLEQICAGESYEVCLTSAIEWTAEISTDDVFLRMRRDIPVPYAGRLRVDDLSIVSLSPERYLRVDTEGRVESCPIKGTRPRGRDPETDRSAHEDLRTNPKDRAENLMIVDLVRNDLTRVCRPGTVEVPRLFAVESFAPVHQLVSTIRGTLRADRDGLDAVAASFPPGSMTGAPKARTMAILDDLESAERGLYAGAMGYITRGAVLDLAVVIRTLVSSGNTHSVGVGGAITALSVPGEELREMLVKASTFRQAVPCERLPSGTGETCEDGTAGGLRPLSPQAVANETYATGASDDGV